MVSQTINFPYGGDGPVTAELRTLAMTVQDTATAIEVAPGRWSAVFTNVPADQYILTAYEFSIPVYSDTITLTLDTALFFGSSEESNELLLEVLANQTANQLEIKSLLQPITIVYSPQPSDDLINLTIGDAYDGVSNPKLTWEVAKSVDAATGVNFKVFDRRNNLIFDDSHGGVDVSDYSGTTVNISLDPTATSLLLDESRDSYRVEVEVVFSPTSIWTISSAELIARY